MEIIYFLQYLRRWDLYGKILGGSPQCRSFDTCNVKLPFCWKEWAADEARAGPVSSKLASVRCSPEPSPTEMRTCYVGFWKNDKSSSQSSRLPRLVLSSTSCLELAFSRSLLFDKGIFQWSLLIWAYCIAKGGNSLFDDIWLVFGGWWSIERFSLLCRFIGWMV